MLPKLIIVTDLDHFKLYTRKVDPKGKLSLSLSMSKNSLNLHKKIGEAFFDVQGSFHGIRGSGTGESYCSRVEKEQRKIKEISEQITTVLENNPHQRWSFSAPQAINNHIVELLPESIKNRLRENLYANLTAIPTDEVLAHFSK
ncbi:MAG: host attachment protein [Pseudomonadota bacterium]